MTNLLISGDYVPDGGGGIRRAEAGQGLLAEILFRLTCRRGSFPLLPELGSRLYRLAEEKPSARDMAARQYAAEALAGLDVSVEDASARILSDGTAQVRVTVLAGDETMTIEVES